MPKTAKKSTKLASKALTSKRNVAIAKKTPEQTTEKSITTAVVGVDGKTTGRMTLPHELFGAKINPVLVAQAVRVFLANQRAGGASTKTRGEVEGSTRKIYRQKGTGRARHGAIRAPIFVGGGIVFGPRPKSYHLELPQKMRKAALASALTSLFGEKRILVVDGLATLAPKTKHMVQMFDAIGAGEKPLFVVEKKSDTLVRSAKNIEGLDVLEAHNLHAYAVISHKKLVLTKGAVDELKETFVATHKAV